MALMTYTEITLDCKSIDWSSGRRKKNVEGEKVVLIISVIYQHAGKLKWEKLLEMEIWLKAKVHLWVSSSPFPYCYLTSKATFLTAPAYAVLTGSICNPIHGQDELLVPSWRRTALKYSHRRHGLCSQMTPNRCSPSPEGHKAATSAGLGCAAVSSLLPVQVCIDQLESPVCAQSLLIGDQWTPRGSQH